MSEIRISFDPEAIKQLTTLNGVKGKNLVANNLYAHEEWLDDDNDGDNPTDHEISGTEFLNFARHIDTDANNVIYDDEIEGWRQANKNVGNSVHNDFTDEEVVELFDMVIKQAEQETGKNSGSTNLAKTNKNDDSSSVAKTKSDYPYAGFVYDPSSPHTLAKQKYDWWAEHGGNDKQDTITFSNVNKIETDKNSDISYSESDLSKKSESSVDGALSKLKGTNFVVQNMYAHEEWLDENEHDGKATNKNVNEKISGKELASFARHIDNNHDGKITKEEFEQWKTNNIAVGNSAHANFTFDQVQEIFNSTKK